MIKNILEKIFGKKQSVQRSLVRDFIIATVIIIICSLISFYIFVSMSATEKLVSINFDSQEDIQEVLSIIKRGLLIVIANAIVVGGVTMQLASRKMLKPITQITQATRKVSDGDFNIELKTKRKDEIGVLTQNFNKMVKDLASIECLQTDFINNISHEIKTPLNLIEGFAKLLKDENLSIEEKNEYTDIILEESKRLLHLSGNILRLSKLQNQEKIINKSEFLISEQIRKVIRSKKAKQENKKMKFNVILDEKEKKIKGDYDLIYGVWQNLIDNAIKFSGNSNKIDIKLEIINNKICISIKDYGIGMEEEECDKIFGKFYQAEKSRSLEGNGLGLAIVKRSLELSNGEIKVESKKGEGTKFSVFFNQIP